VYNQPGYDPMQAAEHLWQKLSAVFA
jgi:hypothetical protein